MFELSGTIKDLAPDIKTGKMVLSLVINEKQSAMNLYDELHEAEKLSIEIKKYRNKRSLEANRYFWHLCGELADKLSGEKVVHTKEDIYRKIISESGVWYDDEVEPEKVDWRRKAWSMIGTGWITERVDFSADGQREIIRFYYGSSQYNTKQMSRLIDNVIQECEQYGIQTKTPNEIANMLSLWESHKR